MDEKVKIISLLRDSWSCAKISKEFYVSEYLVQQGKDLVKTKTRYSAKSIQKRRPQVMRTSHKLCS